LEPVFWDAFLPKHPCSHRTSIGRSESFAPPALHLSANFDYGLDANSDVKYHILA
jgi:hypothetical protein